jgi:hypothetical protein
MMRASGARPFRGARVFPSAHDLTRSMRSRAGAPSIDIAIVINVPPELVLRAFFDPAALGAWLRTKRSVTTPRTLGAYAVEWPTVEIRDEVLGRLGGVFRGTIIQFDREGGFFLADGYWLPPEGDPIGPMAVTVTCAPGPPAEPTEEPVAIATHMRVALTGFEESARWRRYYELADGGLRRALTSLKGLLEP